MNQTTRLPVVICPVRDLATATPFYRRLLGIDPYVESPYYVGFRFGEMELGLDPHGHQQGMTGAVPFLDVGDLRAHLDALVQAGAQIRQEPADVGGGLLVATFADADGNFIGLRQLPKT